MRSKRVYTIAIVSVLALTLLTGIFLNGAYAQRTHGPAIDKINLKVIKSPDATLIALQTGEADMATDLIRTGDIEDLDGRDFTITSQPGFHMGFIGFNIRPDQSYRTDRGDAFAVGQVLSDVNFRHACFYGYNQLAIVASIYKYTVRAVNSLVPPAQAEWYNPAVAKPVFNLGDKYASTVYPADKSTAGLLRYGGYRYDGGADNWVTPYDLDEDGTPGTTAGVITDVDDVIPEIRIFTPTYEVAPTSAEHGARFIGDLHSVGVTSIIHEPHEFWPYLIKVYEKAEFDMFMVFYGLGKYPLQLYSMLHSSQSCTVLPWADGSAGVSHAGVDALVEDIKYGLDHDSKVESCKTVQEMLYDHTHPLWAGDPQSYPYMVLYSRVYFNGFNPSIEGVVDSLGYGSDNDWTHMNMRTASGEITWAWGEEPERLNYMYASTVYSVYIIEKTLDGLIAVSPYDHSNIPWIASDWEIVETPGDPISPMHVVFYLRDDVVWQDGRQFTAYDVKFCLEFMKDEGIPQWQTTVENLVNVTVINDYECKVFADTTSQFLVDYFAAGSVLPPQVWDRDWENWPDPGRTALENILSYDPTEAYSVTPLSAPVGAPAYDSGTHPPPTNLFGTGPFIFEYYDRINMVGELTANADYFMATADIYDLLINLCWTAGDVDAYNEPQEDPNWIWANDKYRYGEAYAATPPSGRWDLYADLNEDGLVDVRDGVRIGYHIGDRLEYPIP